MLCGVVLSQICMLCYIVWSCGCLALWLSCLVVVLSCDCLVLWLSCLVIVLSCVCLLVVLSCHVIVFSCLLFSSLALISHPTPIFDNNLSP